MPPPPPNLCSLMVGPLFLQDYHSLLFGSGRGITSLGSNISHALCLPISLHEVMEMNQRDYIPSEVVHACSEGFP